jgi:hypothetical protein
LIMDQRNDDKTGQNSYRGTGTPCMWLITSEKNFSEIKKALEQSGL